MRAVIIPRPGDPSVLAIENRPDLEPGPNEVRVRVHAAALNRADLLQRRGRYPAPPGAPPDVPGLEFAGTVDGVGPGVTGLVPGARVMGILGGGGHAEQVVTHERLCLPVPEALDWAAAAAIPEAFLTAFDALVLQAHLAPGETVLVPAAASGVGTAALQLAREAGASVIGLVRTAEKRERLQSLGFGPLLDGADPGVGTAVRALAPKGIDVVLDLVGASLWPLHVDLLALRGRIVLVGTMGGSRVEADLSRLMARRATVIGTVLRPRSTAEKIAVTEAFAREVLPLFEAGRLRPLVDRVFAMDEVAEAHAFMEANGNLGKIVLTM